MDKSLLCGKNVNVSEMIDDLYVSLLQELENLGTSGKRLDAIAVEHITDDFNCELCQYFSEGLQPVSEMIAGHINCLEVTLDKLIEWARRTGDPGQEVDILLSACKRPNFSGKWFEYVLDSGWSYRLQFERKLHFHFISVLIESRDLSESEKQRIVEANDGMESFPTREELKRMGF